MSRPARPKKHGFYPHKRHSNKKLSSPSQEAHGKKRDSAFFTDEQGRVRKIPLTKAEAQRLHEQRSTRSRTTDERLKADIAESPARWSRRMNRSDLKGIDYPKTEEAKRKPGGKRKVSGKKRKEPSKSLAQRIHARRSKKARVADESKKAPIVKEVKEWKVKKNRLDMKNVDYPKKAKGKAEAKKTEKQPKKTKKQPSKPEPVVKEVKPPKPEQKKHKAKPVVKEIKPSKPKTLPSREEIEEEAYRMYMMDNPQFDTSPERNELSEEGYLKAAQQNLMSTGTEKQMTDDYIKYLKQDLEERGYTVVPMRM